MTESIRPFIDYFIRRINEYPTGTPKHSSFADGDFDSFDQHICDCLDDYRDKVYLAKELKRFRALTKKADEYSQTLKDCGLLLN